MAEQVGYTVVGTVTKVRGTCSYGHKVGDKFELSGYSADGLCGFFYHDIFPYIITLQFGGTFPWGDPPDRIELECTDIVNAVTIEVHREK